MTATEVLAAVAAGTIKPDEAAALLAPPKRKAVIKLGQKRNVVVKLGSQVRYPTTLYANQWLELAEVMPEIVAFIEANKGKLAWDAKDV